MKRMYLIIGVFAFTLTTRAGIIDLTPGGTPIDFGPPPPVQSHGFYDTAAFGWFDTPEGKTFVRGWVSTFGILNGGQYFFTDLFTNNPSPFADVWWNFGNSGYPLLYVDVFGFVPGGNSVANLYQITHQDTLNGRFQVTLDGVTHITSISFYGRNPALPVPDSGFTLTLLSEAVGALLVCSRKLKSRS
jgi:hypothetical protein